MPYVYFSPEAFALSQSPAYLTTELRKAIHDLTKINFSLQSDRTAAKETLSNLTEFYEVVTVDERFPDHRAYVFLDAADWNKKWQDLQASLDYKNLEKDVKKKWTGSVIGSVESSSSGPDNSLDKSWSFDDASMAFRNSLRIMSDQLGRREGVYTRRDFESKYMLKWNNPLTFSYVKEIFAHRLRLRAFRIAVNGYHQGAWPNLAHTTTLYNINDNLPLTDDFIYIWGDLAAGVRPLLRIELTSMQVIECGPVATAD